MDIWLILDLPRWVLWLALVFGLGIVVEVDGERLSARDVAQKGRAVVLKYRFVGRAGLSRPW